MLSILEKTAILELIQKAGEAVMLVYNNPELFQVEYKEDDSPLTLADTHSHNIISSFLKENYPGIPVISEEDEALMSWDLRSRLKAFWLVDPLDGTKEFIRRTDDFTVNIALVQNGIPVWGAVYAPARQWLYYGGPEGGAWKIRNDSVPIQLPMMQDRPEGEIVAVRSKSHSHPDEDLVLEANNVSSTISIGSSLKFCLVAEGSADVYYRKGPTWEWDTAAAHAVVLGSGAVVMEHDGSDCVPLEYNKKTLKNDYGFICKRVYDYEFY
jgi:3'(2'), 5'-bisphosphate nucleotidase